MAEQGSASGVLLPLAFYDTPGGPVIRCKCGAETALVQRSTVNRSMIGLRASGPSRPRLTPDVGPAAIIAALQHARNHLTATERT